jgi:hypothetical protein
MYETQTSSELAVSLTASNTSPLAKTIFAPPWINSIAEFGGITTPFAKK